MNGQLITAAENTLAEQRDKKIQRGLFVKTTKSLTKTGLSLMWASVLLMNSAILVESNLLRFVCFVAFCLMGLFYIAALRNGGVFEYIPVQPNHSGRQAVFLIAVVLMFAVLINLAFFSMGTNITVFLVMSIGMAAATTALRFVGLSK